MKNIFPAMNDKEKAMRLSLGASLAPWRNALFLIFVFLSAFLAPHPASAQNQLPIVVWVSIDAGDGRTFAQFQAVQAQLSGTPVILKQAFASAEKMSPTHLEATLDRITTAHSASLIFWVEDKEQCTTYYYLPYADPPKHIERPLNIESDTPSGRQEFIAIAAAGMVERLRIAQKIILPKPKPPEPAPPPPPTAQAELPPPALGEFYAEYNGVVFSEDIFQHGIGGGLGLHVASHLTLNAAFSQFFPASTQTDTLKLRLVSRTVSVSGALRLHKNKVDFRLGVAWLLDIRSFDTTLRSETLQEKHSGKKGVHNIAPYLYVGYLFHKRIGWYAKLAMNIPINETNYHFTFDDIVYLVQRPYAVKPVFSSGITIIF